MATFIPVEWSSHADKIYLEKSGIDEGTLYVGLDEQTSGPLLQVTDENLFKALAETLGKRITVADVEVIPATVTVKNEVVYGV